MNRGRIELRSENTARLKAGGHERRLKGELSCKTKISIDPEEGLRALIWQGWSVEGNQLAH